jgi:hypothetical protein
MIYVKFRPKVGLPIKWQKPVPTAWKGLVKKDRGQTSFAEELS